MYTGTGGHFDIQAVPLLSPGFTASTTFSSSPPLPEGRPVKKRMADAVNDYVPE
jgi:hypothetical protein